MKRGVSWSDQEDDSSSSDESSSSNPDTETNNRDDKTKSKKSTAKFAKRKNDTFDFDVLKRHGYKGGLSVLNVPPPKEKPNWTWSSGKDRVEASKGEESLEERQKTRAAILVGEKLIDVQTRKDKNASFSQKEKRKRELGQASRGKNYVEEEKRLLRDNGVYSGFDA